MAIDLNASPKRAGLRAHLCDLPRTSGSNLPKLPPNARFYSRWKRNLQKLVLVSARHPVTRSILRSQAAVAFEKKRHSRSRHRWMIHPCSMLRFYWDAMMTVVFLYIFVILPQILCFHRIGKSDGAERWGIVYPAYVVCMLDILLNFATGFVSSDGNEIFLDTTLAIRHYVRGYFFIDLVSSLPYTWFYPARILPPGPNSNSALLLAEFLPVLKVARMPTVRRNIRRINAYFGISQAQRSTIWLVVLTLLIFHWSSCISYVFPYIVMHIQGRSVQDSDIYYISTKLDEKPDWMVYLMFMHIGVSNLIGSSFVEFESFGTSDTVIRSILLLLGRGYMIYLIVTILQLLRSLADSPEVKYQQIVHQVKEHVRGKKFPQHLQDKLISYYEYRYQGSFFKENVISDTLSSHLNQEILFHSSRGLLETVILHRLPHHTLGNLINSLKAIIFLEEDIIYKAGGESDCMYFIASGTAVLITFSGKEICHLHNGDYFGEIGLLYSDRRRTESVIALEVCELLRLNRRDFKYLFPAKSDFYNSLEHVARERLQEIERLDEQH